MERTNSRVAHKVWLLSILAGTLAQAATDIDKLKNMADEFRNTQAMQKSEAIDFANQHNMPIRQEFSDGRTMEIQKIENGIPRYYTTHNANAAITTRTQHLWSIPYHVAGAGYTALGEWDAGAVLATHQELTGRIIQVDSPSYTHLHSTHVAGTLIASGVVSNAKGMAHQAMLKAYDWNDDNAEMAAAAANGLEVSNHSYGFITGWYGSSHWFGNTTISQNESYRFGFYSSEAQDWDEIAYNAPYYLIIKSAGNDRIDDAPPLGTAHSHNGGGTYTDTHHDDGYDNGGFDTIADNGVAKNILTVGAVYDVADYSSPSDVAMSSFSGWGPADDGRIKPDIVANGIELYSPIDSDDSSYDFLSGTSMASPNAAGTLALLQQYYQNTHNGNPMRSATLKALVLHTADEAGDHIGPNYKFGWGLLNAQKAAEKISEDAYRIVIDELSLSNGGEYTRDITLIGSDLPSLKVTIVWTDPAGTPVSPALDPSDKMLVNDLDLRITKNAVTFYPWKLDRNNPAYAATQNSENNVDNIEQVFIETPTEGTYTITVDHDGTLASAQAFSIILSTDGLEECPEEWHLKQGTTTCIPGISTADPGTYLPSCGPGERPTQGTKECVSATPVDPPGIYLPSCPEGKRLIQGTNQCAT